MTDERNNNGSIDNRRTAAPASMQNWLTRHGLTIAVILVPCFVAYGQVTEKIASLEKEETEISKEMKMLQSDINKQAITIGQVVTTTANIEKQMQQQQRLLEKISDKIMAQRPTPIPQ